MEFKIFLKETTIKNDSARVHAEGLEEARIKAELIYSKSEEDTVGNAHYVDVVDVQEV